MSEVKTFVANASGPAKRTRAVLTALSGAEAGRVLPLSLKTQVTFGRDESCTYSFADGSLSRVHARVVFVAGEYMLKDEGSTNGSFIDDERITKVGHLVDGCRVQLGTSLSFRFSLVTEEEEAALRRVFEAAMTDGLTGLFNRKHTDERLEAELAYCSRHNTPLSIAMVDVDFFKRVNDTYGHPAGDAVLCAVAKWMSEGLRSEDVLGRYGGEEFLVIARGTGLEEAMRMAERLRSRISMHPVTFDGTNIVVTASFGVASTACVARPTTREALVSLADERLYRAKETGRNRVVGT
jgi:two-component system, cell cycle response regulator